MIFRHFWLNNWILRAIFGISKAFIKEQPKGLSTNAIEENLNKEINVGPWEPPPPTQYFGQSLVDVGENRVERILFFILVFKYTYLYV